MLPNNQIKTTAAFVLALAALITPAASAQLKPAVGNQTTSRSMVVRPNPDQQAPPATTANAGPRSEVVDGNGYGPRSTAPATQASTGPCSEVCSGGTYSSANVPTTVVRVTAANGGFDWGAAGVGAAGGIALATLTLAGALAVSQRRGRRTRRSTAAAS